MKFYIYSFLIFSLHLNASFALPRFAVQEGASCIACHVNPTGSGMRNSHGNDIVSLDDLPLKRWLDKGNDGWDGHVTDHLQIGGDLRLQGIQYNDTDTTRKSAFFPMQADMYFNLGLNDHASIFTKVGIKGGTLMSMEYWALISNLPQKSWMKIGQALPNYGLRVDDHTSFIRGGNLSKTSAGLDKEGLIFTPYLSSPIILELGVPMTSGLELTASISTGLINLNDEMNNLTTQLTYRGSLRDAVKYRASFSYMKEDELSMLGVSGGMALGNFTYTFSFDQAENWNDNATSLAIYDELAWELIQGIQIIGKYDFFDPDIELSDGAIARYTLGTEIYPLNIMEIKVQVRINEVDMENPPNNEPEYLIQTHLYF